MHVILLSGHSEEGRHDAKFNIEAIKLSFLISTVVSMCACHTLAQFMPLIIVHVTLYMPRFSMIPSNQQVEYFVVC